MSKNIGLRSKIELEVFRKYFDKEIEEHPLRTLFWECTLRCNAACLHCGSDCKVSAQMKDMPITDFLKVVDNIKPHIDPHKTFIIFTGGECLVRKDLEKAGLELYRREFPWGIVTNGIFLDKKRFDSLIASGMRTATVSLDGFEVEHNWLRGNPHCFEKAVEALKLMAAEDGFIFDVVTCVNQKNFDYLEQFKEFLISIGVRSWRIFTIFPVGRAANVPELQVSNEQFTQVLEFIEKTRREGKIHLCFACEGFLGGYELKVRDSIYQCNAGISVASVLADGSISACPSIRANFHQGNIYKDDFWKVWNEGFKPYRDRSWTRQGICADCKVYKYCRGNGMHLHDETGKLLVCHYNRILR
ncbi:MAG: TIGR04133 family radical SAM/SPASM protein [Bacteroidales bacterium]|nr:TIGR04133 family radical SAM/SPASM protein [Bacteroidales bacterium]MDD4670170.1 TIGR04133 family radical SAM/SPASM protein [Bacteroidales bacterium]